MMSFSIKYYNICANAGLKRATESDDYKPLRDKRLFLDLQTCRDHAQLEAAFKLLGAVGLWTLQRIREICVCKPKLYVCSMKLIVTFLPV